MVFFDELQVDVGGGVIENIRKWQLTWHKNMCQYELIRHFFYSNAGQNLVRLRRLSMEAVFRGNR